MKIKITSTVWIFQRLQLFRLMRIFFILVTVDGFSQSPPKDILNSVVPPSPNAAALGKYGEIPVSLYTGVANITVPIYELKGAELSVPISLSYHPSGIKVDEESSWVGLGWALNAGGVITRAVAGVNDDESNSGYLNTPAIPAKLLDYTYLTGQEATDNGIYLYESTLNMRDPEPDVYYYNFNGYSGKFVFDKSGVPQTIPSSTLRIEVNSHETPLRNFTIVTAEGIRYRFGGDDAYVETSEPEYIKYTDQYAFSSKSKLHQKYHSAWYLAEIKTPAGETVSFTYTPEAITTESNYSQTRFIDFNSNLLTQFSNNSTIKNVIGGQRLSKINFKNKEVEFFTNKIREDLNTTTAKALEKIIIRENGVVLSNYILATSYFQSSGSGYLSKRLKLNSIQEFSADLSKSNPPYSFTYDETPMPPRNSFSQDHWGFYNGKSNPNLIPDLNTKQSEIVKTTAIYNDNGVYLLQDARYNNYVQISDKNKTIRFAGADREPQFPAMQALSLTKVTYPTGGYTNFTYEAHDYKLPVPLYVFKSVNKEAAANSITRNVHTVDVNMVQEIQAIPNADPNKPYYAKVEIGFSALPYMQQLKLCATVKPEIRLEDLTTGTTVINFRGAGLSPSPVVYTGAGDEFTMDLLGSVWTISDIRINPTHTYRLFAEMYPCEYLPPDPYYSSIRLYVTVPTTQIQTYNGGAGGLRIRMIESKGDGIAPMVKKFIYKKFGEVSGISSGVLGQLPVYMELNQTINTGVPTKTYSTKVSGFKKAVDNNLFNTQATYTSVMGLYSGSRYVLGQTSGSHIGYTEVQEWSCDDVSAITAVGGKIIHRFTSFNDHPDVNPTVIGLSFTGGINPFVSKADPMSLNPGTQYTPFAIPMSYDYKRGLITYQEYRNSANVIVKKVQYTYNAVTEVNNLKIIDGLKIMDLTQRGDGGHDLVYAKYSYRAAWNYLNQKTEITYDQNGANPSTVTTSYEYSNPVHMQLTGASTIFENAGTSNQRKLYTRKYYPLDYTFQGVLSDNATAIRSMAMEKHIWNVPVEQLNYTVIGSTQFVTEGYLSAFKLVGSGVAKDKDYILKFNNSTLNQDRISFTPGVINSSGKFIQDPHYELLNSYNRYDTNCNLLELSNRQNTSCLIREPNTGNVWAKAVNSNYSSIAYSSFEHIPSVSSAFTNWNYNTSKITNIAYQNGSKAYNLSGAGAITTIQSLVFSQKYKVSLWRKVGSGSALTIIASGVTLTQRPGPTRKGWQYVEAIFTGASALSITGDFIIDELRLYPVNARMGTYTYKDGVGMSSECNESNQTTFFEYDELNRLKLIRDQGDYILKKNEYKYQHIQN